MASYEANAFARAAGALGLFLHEQAEAYAADACFERLVRAAGPRVPGPSGNGRLWMAGRTPVAPMQRDVEVIVLCNTITSQSMSTEANPGGSSTSTDYTHVVAHIDPPLFLGLHVVGPRPIEFGATSFNVLSNEVPVNTTFGIRASMPGPASQLVSRQAPAPNDLVDHLVAIRRWGVVRISDSAVDVQCPYTADVAELAPRVASAAALAAYLASRRGPLGRDAGEHSRVAAWGAFAESERLAFDRDRLAITFEQGGARVRIAVEVEGEKTFTALRVDGPGSLGLGLRLTRQGGLQFLFGLFGSQDVKVGDEAFDKAFVVKARDEAGVKRLLGANAAARGALLSLLQGAPDLVVDDAGAVARWPSMADHGGLTYAVTQARALAGLWSAGGPPSQAYR